MQKLWFLLLLTPFWAAGSHLITVPEVPTPPVLDGKASDQCWNNAGIVFNLVDHKTGAPVQGQTVLKLIRHKDMLYGLAECHQQGANKLAAAENPQDKAPYLTSGIELFFTNGQSIYQFAFNYADRIFEREWLPKPLGPEAGPPYSGKMQTKAVVTPSGWTAEFAIPIASLHLKGESFGLNVVRNNKSANETSTWMIKKYPRSGWAAQYKHFPKVVFSKGPAPKFTISGKQLTIQEDLVNLSWPERKASALSKGTVLKLDTDKEFRLDLQKDGKTVYKYTYIPPEKVTLSLGQGEINFPVLHFSPFMPCQISWQSSHTFPVAPKDRVSGMVRKKFEIVFDLPEGVKLLNGKELPQTVPGRRNYVRKLANLKRIKYKNDIPTLFSCSLKPGSKDVLRYYVRWDEGRTSIHEIPIVSVDVKPAAPPKKVVIGMFGPVDKWTEELQKAGLNQLGSLWYNRTARELKRIQRWRKKGFKVAWGAANNVPIGSGHFFKNWTDKDRSARAVDINGYYIINPQSKVYQISPSYRGKLFYDGLKATREYCQKAGFQYYCFDTEDYLQGAGEKGDFSKRTIDWFEKWFKEKHPGKEYISPFVFEREPAKYPYYHQAWIDFKCEIWADFFNEIKKSMNVTGEAHFIDYGVLRVDEKTTHQRLTNRHWLKVFDSGIGGGWYSGVDRSVRHWVKAYDDMRKQWKADPAIAVWLNPTRLTAYYSATTGKPVKDEMKYKFFEAMTLGAKSIFIYKQVFMDMDAVRQLSDAVRVLNQCEDIVYHGKRIEGLTTDVPNWEKLQDYYEMRKLITWKDQPKVIVKGMEYKDQAVISVAEYREQIERNVKVYYTFKQDSIVKDLEIGKIVASPKAGEKFFPVKLDADRCCRIFLISPANKGE